MKQLQFKMKYKKVAVLCVSIFISCFIGLNSPNAQFVDPDGNLAISWSPPEFGTAEYYEWSYTINGVVDSVTGSSPGGTYTEESVTLSDEGDWAIFNILSVSNTGDSSITVSSETAFYLEPCSYITGDSNGSGSVNGLDVTYFVAYLKGNAMPHICYCQGVGGFYASSDVNGDCSSNGLDVSYIVNYFKGGPSLIPCDLCPPN